MKAFLRREKSVKPVKEPKWEPVEESLSRSSRNQRQQKQETNIISSRLCGQWSAFCGLVATGIFAVTYIHSAVKPMDKNATLEFVTVEIPAGSSNRERLARSRKRTREKNGQFFTLLYQVQNYSSQLFQPSKEHGFRNHIQKLQEGGPITKKLLRLQFLER